MLRILHVLDHSLPLHSGYAFRTLAILRGRVTFVPVTNPLAYAKGERAGDRNLNRNLGPVAEPADYEDHVANWLCPLLAQHEALLDLHSTRAKSRPFAMLGPQDNPGPLQPFAHSREERALAQVLGVDRFLDMCRTTLNVTGDLTCATVVGRGEPDMPETAVPASSPA